MNELRPNDQRAKAAIAMIWAFLSINIFHIVFKLFISPTSNHLADRHIRENLQTVYDTQHFFSEFIALANYLMPFFMIIMFIRWFRRAYLNLGIITNECFHDDSWAVKGWFVPVLNLYIPYQIMKELYDKTNSYLLEKILFSNNSNSYIKKLNIKLVK
ncbi:hypothetical protein GGR21_002633 [Dysgonomonas hofstadii]|uniref:DUF4328 domain-containing protein n=1 Tax=Dysgonomonas hofstadii TaxID=637886 RepID=A0A840CKY8_9BACT|nr:DUF4328 domain-containing protein [Dysgonomonas hofstadii]MBB4036727.1 hypothetical protein [Dysgonomonas hofstadii]